MADNKITFFGKCDGISVEQLIRYSRFNMNVKHFHNQYEIFYIIEGERQFFFDNKSYNAYAGDIAILDTNLVHTTCSISDEDKGYNAGYSFHGRMLALAQVEGMMAVVDDEKQHKIEF